MKNRLIAGALVMLAGVTLCAEPVLMRAQAAEAAAPAVKELKKSNSGNPMLGFDADGNILYGGDPSIWWMAIRLLLCGTRYLDRGKLFDAGLEMLFFERYEKLEI